MKHTTLGSLWKAIKELIASIYQWLVDDQKRMDELKEQYIREQKRKDDEISKVQSITFVFFEKNFLNFLNCEFVKIGLSKT